MASLQSLLNDPGIASFLKQIPQNEHLITLKELIYIGIKIVTNSVSPNITPGQTLSQFANKQNKQSNQRKQKHQNNSSSKNVQQKVLQQKDKHGHKSNTNITHVKKDKLQSALLREISKIRVQLQNLTNKVYDGYFEEGASNGEGQKDDGLVDANLQDRDRVVSYGFGGDVSVPTFSPERRSGGKKKHEGNPFLKQKGNNDHNVVQAINKPTEKNIRSNYNPLESSKSNYPLMGDTRTRGRSHLRHLDDTQVREALYAENVDGLESEFEGVHRNRTKKSQSVIEMRVKEKKKEQENYFYQLNVEKQRLEELKVFMQSRNMPEDSYREFYPNKAVKIDPVKRKVRSKIKPQVERDRLRYQNKKEEEQFQRGFEQYEYSVNEGLEEQQQEEEEMIQEENGENGEEIYQQEEEQDYEEEQEQDGEVEGSSKKKSYMNSPQEEYEREREVAQPGFGFYDSRDRSVSSKIGDRRQFESNGPHRVVNGGDEESSFSQFSEFSMSSNNSRRENGKISRRRNQ